MEVDGYDPDNDPRPTQPATLGPNGQIVVNKPNGRREGYLAFLPGNEEDGKGVRVFLTLMMILSILGIVALLYLMIKSFI